MPDHEDQAFRTAPILPEGSTGRILFAPWLALGNHARRHEHHRDFSGFSSTINPSTSTLKQKPPVPKDWNNRPAFRWKITSRLP